MVTIVARGADAVGSLHRYVTIIDSDGAVYLVGFGDATVPGYLTPDGQWGDGRDLPETMEFGSVMAAYYNDNTEGANNLALLPALAGVGINFAPRLVANPGSGNIFNASFSCVDGVLHVLNGSTDLGWVDDDDTLVSGASGAIGCDGGHTERPSSGVWMDAYPLTTLVSSDTPVELQSAWNCLLLILTGHINYTWPST